jgi:hypothetical protein
MTFMHIGQIEAIESQFGISWQEVSRPRRLTLLIVASIPPRPVDLHPQRCGPSSVEDAMF